MNLTRVPRYWLHKEIMMLAWLLAQIVKITTLLPPGSLISPTTSWEYSGRLHKLLVALLLEIHFKLRLIFLTIAAIKVAIWRLHHLFLRYRV